MNELCNQILSLPLAAFGSWMGWLVQIARGLQQVADRSFAAVAAVGGAAAGAGAAIAAGQTDSSFGVVSTEQGARGPGAATEAKEKRIMADKDLSNDRVKLVQYSIISIDRGAEKELGNGQKLVSDNLTGEAFATWTIAEWVQEHPVPHGIKKYLRVYYSVLDSWAREPLQYEEQQLEILRGIQHAIVECCKEGGRPFRGEAPAGGGRGRGGAGARA